MAVLGSVLLLAACAGAPDLRPGERTCAGFPADVCARQVAELEREGRAHGGVVAYRVVCTSASCTSARGDGTESVVFADGTGREGGFGYAAAEGMPPEATFRPLPVAPSCLGVPAAWCAEQARAGAEMVSDWSTIATITVRCTGACSPAAGEGETRLVLRDGTARTQGWNYSGEAPPVAP
jgi:hypothetical protein